MKARQIKIGDATFSLTPGERYYFGAMDAAIRYVNRARSDAEREEFTQIAAGIMAEMGKEMIAKYADYQRACVKLAKATSLQ
jgi:hypothetical protein